ncbi:MAG TPA: hypothetical protein VF177_20815 [Anaerolineae bacterium]
MPAKGLGASDISGNTHLLRVTTGESWWQFLPARLNALLEKETTGAGAHLE